MDCKCLLCGKRKADKTGSHIVPSFIMKRINGDGKRDHEVGFVIKSGIVKPYFGRDIYEDKRRTITGREDLMESRTNYDVRDNIFCKECENYFGTLESAYAPSLDLSFMEDSETVNKKVSSSNALLFWCSVVWRLSVTGHLDLKLFSELEDRLRVALETKNTDALNVKYALFRCKDYGKVEGRSTSVCMDVKDKSVLLIADDFMLIMVFDVEEKQHIVKLMNMELNLKSETLNCGCLHEKISPLPVSFFDDVCASIIHMAIRSMQLPSIYQELHNHLFGGELPEVLLNDILYLMQNNPCKLGDRYSVEHYAYCYKEVLVKYGYIRECEDGSFSVLKRV